MAVLSFLALGRAVGFVHPEGYTAFTHFHTFWL
jgi:hypothetical protein